MIKIPYVELMNHVIFVGQCQEENIDYNSNDAGSASGVKTWNACADLCSKKDTCFAWTWVSKEYKGPHKIAIERCFFKNKNFSKGRKTFVGAISGTSSCTGTGNLWNYYPGGGAFPIQTIRGYSNL